MYHDINVPISAQPKHVDELCVCDRARFGELHDCARALLSFDGEEMHELEGDELDEGIDR